MPSFSFQTLIDGGASILSSFGPVLAVAAGMSFFAILAKIGVGLFFGGDNGYSASSGGAQATAGAGGLSGGAGHAPRSARQRGARATGAKRVKADLTLQGSPRRQAVALAHFSESKEDQAQRWKDWHNDPYMTGSKGAGMRARARGLSLKD